MDLQNAGIPPTIMWCHNPDLNGSAIISIIGNIIAQFQNELSKLTELVLLERKADESFTGKPNLGIDGKMK
jgi:hypothetical protein